MRIALHTTVATRALALSLLMAVAAPGSIAALTPDDAIGAFDMFLYDAHVRVPHADSNCDGVVTPGDARALYQRYLLDLPAGPCADHVDDTHASPRMAIRHRVEPGIAGHPTTCEVTIEAAGAVTAFGLRVGYPAEQLRMVSAGPGADVEHWIAADAVVLAPGEILAGGFDVGATSGTRTLQLVRIVFEARGAVDWRRIAVREMTDDLAGATIRLPENDSIPSQVRLRTVASDPAMPAIGYDIPVATGSRTRVRLTIYDASGGVARVLVDGMEPPGFHAARWDGNLRDGSPAGPGVYYARLQARMGTDDVVDSMKVVIR